MPYNYRFCHLKAFKYLVISNHCNAGQRAASLIWEATRCLNVCVLILFIYYGTILFNNLLYRLLSHGFKVTLGIQINEYGVALVHVTAKNQTGREGFHVLLNEPFERTSAINRIIAAVDNIGFGRWRESDGQLLISKTFIEIGNLQLKLDEMSLEKENDALSKERLQTVKKELADNEDKLKVLNAQWENEKNAVERPAKPKRSRSQYYTDPSIRQRAHHDTHE